jgi:1,2-phenylacetyl-CoA epoxidase catalytic subunit
MEIEKSEVSWNEKRRNADRKIRENFINEMIPCLRELGLKYSLVNVQPEKQRDGLYKYKVTK